MPVGKFSLEQAQFRRRPRYTIMAPPIKAKALAPETGSISGVGAVAEAATQAPRQNSTTAANFLMYFSSDARVSG